MAESGAGNAPLSKGFSILCTGHSRPVTQFVYSAIVEDSFWIVSSCLDGKPMIRNGETGDWVGTLEGHKGAVWDTAIDLSASRVATASADYNVKLWNALNGKELLNLEHDHVVKSVDVNADASRLVSGCMDCDVRVYDVASEEETVKLAGHEKSLKSTLFFPKGEDTEQLVLSGDQDGHIRLWDVRSGSVVRTFETGGALTSLQIVGDVMVVVSGQKVDFLDAKSFDVVKVFEAGFDLESAGLSPDKRSFVVGASDFPVRVYNFDTLEELECNRGHHGPVHCTRFAPDSKSYASSSEDGTIRIWTDAGAPEGAPASLVGGPLQ